MKRARISTTGPDYDLVIAADGANSRIRSAYEPHFGVDVQVRRNKFFWYGTAKVFDAFTFAFEQTQAGWVWAHAYRFDDALSTFIVEMAPETWSKLGLDRMDQPEAIALCERIFARYLDGHALQSNAQHLPGPQAWLTFRRIICERWSYRNLILLATRRTPPISRSGPAPSSRSRTRSSSPRF
jgi:anthraniloyl-CoA monooxygenase